MAPGLSTARRVLGRLSPLVLALLVAAPRAGAAELDADRELVLAAGRIVPPGLPAARRLEREELREQALARLQAELGGGGTRPRVLLRLLEELLAAADRQPELAAAAARAVGRLGQYDLQAPLVAALRAASAPEVRAAALAGLHDLYGTWLFDPAAPPEEARAVLASWSPPLAGGPDAFYLVGELRRREEQDAERLLQVLRYDPAPAKAWLSDADPLVRVTAARALKERLASGVAATAPAASGEGATAGDVAPPQARPPAPGETGEETGELLALLLDRLRRECEPRAYHALLDALLVGVDGVAPDARPLRELRGVLLERCGERSQALRLSSARALARLPWEGSLVRGEGGAATLALAALAAIGAVLEDQALDPVADSDVTIGLIDAVQVLCTRAGGEDPAQLARRAGVRPPVLVLLRRQSLDPDLRLAAAHALALLALPEDVPLLVAALERSGEPPTLRYALLGALGSLARRIDPAAPEASVLRESLLARIGDPNADLRRRCLSLLVDEQLAPLWEQLDPTLLIQRLADEPVPELRLELLQLVGRHGRPSQLDQLLGLEGFDTLAGGDPHQTAALTQTLERLAAGREGPTVAAARRLLAVRDPDSRLVRLELALGMVADLEPGAAARLQPRDHATILRWGLELRASGVDLASASTGGIAMLERLVDLHLPAGRVEFGPAESHHLHALLLGDLRLAEHDRADPAATEEVVEHFDLALDRARRVGDEQAYAHILRDRARFLARVERDGEALRDYRALLADPGAVDLLDLADLRTAADLAETVEPEAGAPARAPLGAMARAFDLSLTLVRSPSWTDEPPSVRLRDLVDLGERGLASGDPGRLATVRALLAGLPDALPASGAEAALAPVTARPGEGIPREAAATAGAASGPPLWEGLLAEPQDLATLRDLLARAGGAGASSASPVRN